jgi:branched-chain amino acid transport system ATP-binding protein
VLVVKGLIKRFGGFTAVNDVSFKVDKGEILGLIGPNGAGKTTFFNVVTGLLSPDQGEILFEGRSIVGLRPNAIVGRGIARTFQSIRLFQNMTILDNILVGEHSRLSASVAGAVFRPPRVRAEEQRARARALELIQFVGLGGKDQELAKNLPYGDQRRLEIARALATEPKLLLLDEPAAGTNPTEKRELMQDIARIRDRGVTVLLIEHDMGLIQGICERVVVLDHGIKIAEGEFSAVRRNPTVLEAYLGRRHA